MSAYKQKEILLLVGVFLISISGLVYELLNSTLSSYLLGDAIYYFSLVIGLFMSSMGLGAYLSRFFENNIEESFVKLQITIALIGGFSAFILFYAFAFILNYEAFLYLITVSLGVLIGLEIPLVIRILKNSFSLKVNISNIFTVDYIGALVASLLFPLVLVPHLGLMQSSFLFGLVNLFVAILSWYIFRKTLKKSLLIYIFIVLIALVFGIFKSRALTSFIDNKLYLDSVIYSKATPYQKLVISSSQDRVKFFINGAIQFDSFDEYRYHESLIHPVMSATRVHKNILVIGGGDGLAVREILKYPDVKSITLVDLDPAVTTLFKSNKRLTKLNTNSLSSPKVTIVNQDAWKFLEHSKDIYDVVIIDLPDPNSISLSRLYTKSFYNLIKTHLAQGGAMVTQATSPLYTREAFYSILKTASNTFKYAKPYHVYVPSFGEWGFVMGAKMPIKFSNKLPKDLKYLNQKSFKNLFEFSNDISKIEVEPNMLSTHKLLKYYNSGWEKWYE